MWWVLLISFFTGSLCFSQNLEPVGLNCSEVSALAGVIADRVQGHHHASAQLAVENIFFRGESLPVLAEYQSGEVGVRMVKVRFPQRDGRPRHQEGLVVIKQFPNLARTIGFMAQMNQLADEGVPVMQPRGQIDRETFAVKLQNHQLISLEELDPSQLPSGLWEKLLQKREAFVESVNRVGLRRQIIAQAISPSSVYLDLDFDTFRVVHLH
jgi:hypothetical protein